MSKSVIVFEWLSGGGLAWNDQPLIEGNHLFHQGFSMMVNVAQDLAAAGFDVSIFQDERTPDSLLTNSVSFTPIQIETSTNLPKILAASVDAADAVLVIAPECEGILLDCCNWLKAHQSKWLFPSHDFVRLCSNKTTTVDLLKQHNIRVPHSFRTSEQHKGPIVVKPEDGCGSIDLVYLSSSAQLPATRQRNFRVEHFVAGVPASVSLIASRNPIVLPPLRQVFDRQPIGTFVESVDDLTENQIELAKATALKVAYALPPTNAFFGIDMVITEEDATVIEVNPRLTDSYGKLREVSDFNLAEQMMNRLFTAVVDDAGNF